MGSEWKVFINKRLRILDLSIRIPQLAQIIKVLELLDFKTIVSVAARIKVSCFIVPLFNSVISFFF